jgi:hypothetical protein
MKTYEIPQEIIQSANIMNMTINSAVVGSKKYWFKHFVGQTQKYDYFKYEVNGQYFNDTTSMMKYILRIAWQRRICSFEVASLPIEGNVKVA